MPRPKSPPTTVMGLSELRRIQTQLLPPEKQADPAVVRALERKELSDAKKANWTNTLEGGRKANLAKRQQRLEAEEMGIYLNSLGKLT